MNIQPSNYKKTDKKLVRYKSVKSVKSFENKKPYKSIEELFADFKGEYEPIEIDWGKPVGKEIW